jgi:hypothetical protein
VGETFYGSTPGSYQVRVELARGIDLESDASYNNDSVLEADSITLEEDGIHRTATVAGTLMLPEGLNFDEDLYALGVLNAGNVVELTARLPSSSTLTPGLTVFDGDGIPVADEDGDPLDAHFRATIPSDGSYYAAVGSYWVSNGRAYVVTGSLRWPQAEESAQLAGAHLVTVSDQAEQDWLYATFGPLLGHFWIGLSDAAEEGTWVWSSGEPVSYTNWASGEPNSGSSYDYALVHSDDGLWYDEYYNRSYAGVAELEDVQGRVSVEPGWGPRGQYLLDVDVSDPVPPAVVSVSRLPEDGAATSQMLSTFSVTVSEALDPSTVNTPHYDLATYHGHVYALISDRPWQEAESWASSRGGYLVSINDADENAWLRSRFSGEFWIGLSDTDLDNVFEWSSGESLDYTNWGWQYTPTASNYNYVGMYGDGRWFNWDSNSTSRPAVVEFLDDTDSDGDGLPDALDDQPSDPLNGWDLRDIRRIR